MVHAYAVHLNCKRCHDSSSQWPTPLPSSPRLHNLNNIGSLWHRGWPTVDTYPSCHGNLPSFPPPHLLWFIPVAVAPQTHRVHRHLLPNWGMEHSLHFVHSILISCMKWRPNFTCIYSTWRQHGKSCSHNRAHSVHVVQQIDPTQCLFPLVQLSKRASLTVHRACQKVTWFVSTRFVRVVSPNRY